MTSHIDILKSSSVNIVDEFGSLKLVTSKNFEHAFIKGVVFEESGKIIAASFPHTGEVSFNDPFVQNVVNGIFKKIDLYLAPEGTIVRIFWSETENRWFFSTHHKLNGEESRWKGHTFKSVWADLWGNSKNEDFMDKNRCYVFLVSHPENALYCKSTHSITLVAVLEQTENTLKFVERALLQPHPNVSFPTLVSQKELQAWAQDQKTFDNQHYTGVLAVIGGPTFDSIDCLKIMTEEFMWTLKVRGSDPNIVNRYFELYMKGYSQEHLEKLYSLGTEGEKKEMDYFESKCPFVFYLFLKDFKLYWMKRLEKPKLPQYEYVLLQKFNEAFRNPANNQTEEYTLLRECAKYLNSRLISEFGRDVMNDDIYPDNIAVSTNTKNYSVGQTKNHFRL